MAAEVRGRRQDFDTSERVELQERSQAEEERVAPARSLFIAGQQVGEPFVGEAIGSALDRDLIPKVKKRSDIHRP
ncbi:MAG: hypothetical protein JJE40_03025 [Vicinamibacteria bacterium]|nr:hypothetical protein [Vicinamibacteria bacterium]